MLNITRYGLDNRKFDNKIVDLPYVYRFVKKAQETYMVSVETIENMIVIKSPYFKYTIKEMENKQ